MATPNDPKVPDLLEIIFADRNKEYGAYNLRKTYPKVIRNATIAGILFFGLAVGGPTLMTLFTKDKGDEKEDVTVKLENLPPPPPLDENKPPPPPPPPPPPEPPPQATIKFVPPKPVEDAKVIKEEPPPKLEEMKDVEIATETKEGVKTTSEKIEDVVYEEPPKVEEKIKVEEPVKKEEPPEEKEPENKVFEFAEQTPEFPGGTAAMLGFLQENIQYPEIARRAGIEGPVYVQFIVSETGSISNAVVTRGIGGGCDEEALRVVNSMPKWRPGKQNGQPVKVKHTIQVRFKLR
jgi:protein TonB